MENQLIKLSKIKMNKALGWDKPVWSLNRLELVAHELTGQHLEYVKEDRYNYYFSKK